MASSGVPQIDYNWLSDLPTQFGEGRAYQRQNQLRDVLGTEDARKLLEAQDFGGLAALVSGIDPEYGRKMLQGTGLGGSNPYGANLYYGERTNPDTGQSETVLLQPSRKGGIEEAPAPAGITVTPPTVFPRTATGIQVRSSRGGRELQPEIPMDIEEAVTQREAAKRQVELDFTRPKVKTNIDLILSKWAGTEAAISRAEKLAGPASTGLVGSATANIPTSPAFELRAEVERIQATLAFKELEAMRQASPTGSGLGQISNYEDRLLALVNGSLAPGVKEETLRRNLNEIRQIQRELNQIIQREFKNTYGFEWNQEPPPGAGGPRVNYPTAAPEGDPNANLGPNELPISPTPPPAVAAPAEAAPAAPGGVIDYNDYFR